METQPDEQISRIAAAVCCARGSELFESIVANLADALCPDVVFLAEGIYDGKAIRVLAASPGSQLSVNADHRCGEMCAAVLRGKSCVVPAAARSVFVDDALAAMLGVDGFAGVPLLDSADRTIGLMAVVYRRPIPDPERVLLALNTLARRAAAELERRQTERALRQTEQRYKAFISHCSEGVWRLEFDPPVPTDLPPEQVTDLIFRSGYFAEVNDAHARNLGFDSAEELLGRPLTALADTSDRRAQVFVLVRQGLPAHLQLFHTVDRKGVAKWLERNAVPIVEDGKLMRVWGTTRNVTARQIAADALKDSEARYRTLFEAAGQAIFLGKGDRILDCNSRAVALFGASTREQLVGRLAWELSPELQADGSVSRDVIPRRIARAYDQPAYTYESRHLRLDGTVIDTEVTLSGLLLSGEQHWLTLIRDITGRKAQQRQIQELNAGLEVLVAERTAQLEAARQELEAFSYSVSHDLRAAIRGIQSCSEIVLQEHASQIDDAGRKWLEYIREDTNQLDKLTLALLDLSRLSRAPLNRTDVDLTAICHAVAQRLEQTEPGRRAHWKIADGMRADGDPVLLRVVMENLMGNAWKFTRNREMADIEIGSEETADKSTAYWVKDNGVGFDMRLADRLFGAFQRLNQSAEFEGSGIGLATVRRIVHRHGGRVWADGAVGKGATITFTLQEIGRRHERATSGIAG